MSICPCGIARDDCDYHKPVPVVSQGLVYDVSGTAFVAGVTNFTVENLFDALDLVWCNGRDAEDFRMTTHTALFMRFRKCNLLDCDINGQWSLQGMPVSESLLGKAGGVFDSLIQHSNDGRQVILRTREH
jgi:hypothetical protein